MRTGRLATWDISVMSDDCRPSNFVASTRRQQRNPNSAASFCTHVIDLATRDSIELGANHLSPTSQSAARH